MAAPKLKKRSNLVLPEILSPIQTENPLLTRSNTTEREKKNSSVTPRKFKRFFTPRHLELGQKSAARQALYDVTRPALNCQGLKMSPARQCLSVLDSSPPETLSRETKRRKRYHTPEISPRISVPICPDPSEPQIEEAQQSIFQSSPCERAAKVWDSDESELKLARAQILHSILPVCNRSLSGKLLERSYGNFSQNLRQHYTYPVNDFQDLTASFYSKSNDAYLNTSLDGPGRTIPFCVAACHTNSLVAIGDQEGCIRLLEAGDIENCTFSDTFLGFRVHQNAIIDMNFSENDSRLVTASGDQSSRVIDMSTQTTISILGAHTASLKQARFQPGRSNNDVIATSGRDGSIHLWDLRCKGYDKPLIHIDSPNEHEEPHSTARKAHYGALFNSIFDAHKEINQITPPGVFDFPKYGESATRSAGRFGYVSVTAIEFISTELNHLLISASEASSSIKLWDIRQTRTNRRHRSKIPLSSTAQPQSHSKWRQFGVSSMNISSDGTRIYTLSKDNTVYVYSTAHLMLGQSSSLVPNNQGRPALITQTQNGLGPLYGFRHPKFHATSFYVKSAIRKPEGSICEMLAVGSSDGCAVIFPTDERYIPHQGSETTYRNTREELGRPDNIPISTRGTALIRGHDREVGPLAWAQNGALVTVGDDFLVRAWREGDEARNLRTGGESGGRRWNCGWAEINDNYDNDER